MDSNTKNKYRNNYSKEMTKSLRVYTSAICTICCVSWMYL